MRALAAGLVFVSLGASAGEVTVIRPSAFIAPDSTYYVVLDEKPVFDLRSREHVRFSVPAGRHTLAVRCPKSMTGTYAETRIEQRFDAQPAFFVVTPKFDCASLDALEAQAAAPLVRSTDARPAARPIGYEDGKVDSAEGAAPSAPSAKNEDIASATAAWVDAYNSRDAARISALYDTQAVFWTIDSKKPSAGAAAIRAYFESAVAHRARRVALGEHAIRTYGDIAIDSGTCTFFDVVGASPVLTPARYTLVYRQQAGKWMIVHHESFRLPAP